MNTFLEEIREQPKALQQTLEYYLDPKRGGKLLEEVRRLVDEAPYTHIMFTGMGSSFFNSHISYYYLNTRGISCDIYDAGELAYFLPPARRAQAKSILIGVSQSGESGELVRFLQANGSAWKSTVDFWCITNNIDSTLGKAASRIFPTIAGPETSVTSKTYVTGILVHYLVARALAGEISLSPDIQSKIRTVIQTVSEADNKSENAFGAIARKMQLFLGKFEFLNFIGQGASMATVLQATLNLKEISKIYAEGITIGMFRHGPIEIITPKYRCVFLISDPVAADLANPVISNITGKWGGGKVVLISNCPERHQGILNSKILMVENPIRDPYLATI